MFESRIRGQLETVLSYESTEAKSKALRIIPVEKLKQEAREAVELAQEFSDDEVPEFEDCLMEALLYWFKRDFFTWVDRPPCWNCSSSSTELIGMTRPSTEDLKYGAGRVEAYRCPQCSATILFPRYNDPVKLLETRKGRCGEWANCFTFLCRSLELDVRFVLDWADHVWTEYFSMNKGRWIHVDCCEAIMDKPLLYETGWGKKQEYVIAVHRYGITDVTQRYTQNWNEVRIRRRAISESDLDATLKRISADLRTPLSTELQQSLSQRDEAEKQDLLSPGRRSGATETLPGRTTGSADWRRSRGETGSTSRVLRPSTVRYKRLHYPRKNSSFLCDGIVRCSGENPPHETLELLFDGDLTTKWLDFGGGGLDGSSWIEYCLPKSEPVVELHSYALVSAKDTPDRDPSSWELQGLIEGDNTEWKCLHEQTNAIFNSRGMTMKFEISTLVPCRRFRLCIWKTRNPQNANSVQLGQLQLFANGLSDRQQETNTDQVQQDFATKMKQLFNRFVAEGLAPNEAAAKALNQLRSSS
eukprot:g8449.t1